MATALGSKKVEAFCDSQLVANQYSGEYETRDERMEAYLKVVKELTKNFEEFSLTRIPRGENTSADALAALASTSDSGLERIIPVETIKQPSIATTVAVVITIEGGIGEMKYYITSRLARSHPIRWQNASSC